MAPKTQAILSPWTPCSRSVGTYDPLNGSRMGVRLALSCSLLMVLMSPLAFAQSTARVTGFVTDQSGAVVPAASVTLRDEASGTEIRGVTDATGFYSFDPVPPRTYALVVSKDGFKTYTQSGLAVHTADRLEVSVNLQVGHVAERVEVKAAAENAIPTDSGAKINVIAATQIQNLSTVGRNALELLTLLPGVVNLGFDPSKGSNYNTDLLDMFSVNGLQRDATTFQLDNANNVETAANRALVIEPNMDQIAEFAVKTSNFEADQGRNPVIITAITKSGGSEYHGMLYWYHRNAALNANDFSNNLAGLAKPNDLFNYPGFNFGGPVRLPGTDFNKNRDKMFFFVGAEWQRQLPDPGTQFAVVPTARMRTGDFSELLNPKFCKTDSTGKVIGGRYLKMPCILTDPNDSGGAALPGNTLPSGDITANGKAFLNLFPLPNYVDPNGVFNFAGRPLRPINRNSQTVKVDYNLNEKTRLYVRWAHEGQRQIYDYGLWSGENSGWTSNIPEPTPIFGDNRNMATALNLVISLNPTLVNEFQFNLQTIRNPNTYQDPSKLSKKALGFQFNGMFNNGVDTVPQITDAWNYFGGSPGAGRWGAGDLASGVFYKLTDFEFIDNLTKVRGTHTMKFGFLADRIRNNQNPGVSTEGMLITDTSWGLTSGNEFGDILSEHYKAFAQASSDPYGLYRMWGIEWHAQDSWKIARRLTLNYGARFSWMQPWSEVAKRGVTFDPRTYDTTKPTSFSNGLVLAKTGQIPDSVIPNRSVTVQPRIGFAWDVFGGGKSVLRGGFGAFVPRDQANFINFVAASPPNSFNSTPINQFTSLADIQAQDPFGALGNISMTALDRQDNGQAQVYEWSLTWSQGIGLKTTLETSYVGNSSRHLFVKRDINAAPLGSMWAPGTQTLTGTNNQAFRSFKPWGSIIWANRSSTANYNGLQVSVRRNVSAGLTLLGSYTFSKTLGFTDAEFTGGLLDPFFPNQNYRLLNFDRPHLFTLSFIYPLPPAGAKYFGGNRVAKGVFDGWQLSGVTRYASGAPLAVANGGISCVNAAGETNAASVALCGGGSFTGDGRTWYGTQDEPVRPVVVSNPQSGAAFSGLNTTWLSPASLSLPNIGQLGIFEQPTFRSPGFNNWDFTLFKKFHLGEKRELEFRWAAFDIVNRAQLDFPQTTANFNWVLPLGATSLSKGRAVLSNTDTFGKILNKHGHRQMEAAIKLYF